MCILHIRLYKYKICKLLLLCTRYVNSLFILSSSDKKMKNRKIIMTLSFNGKYEFILGPN